VKIVIDTGIWVSALITKDTPPGMLYQAWSKGAFQIFTSEAQLDEIKRVLGYKKLERFIQAEEAKTLLEKLNRSAELVTDLPEVNASPDPDDNLIIATAIAGKVDYLISGDKRDMLSLKKVEDIPIITARYAVDNLFE
jgi:putative PIN family toxin of toxin-antitoxin system